MQYRIDKKKKKKKKNNGKTVNHRKLLPGLAVLIRVIFIPVHQLIVINRLIILLIDRFLDPRNSGVF